MKIRITEVWISDFLLYFFLSNLLLTNNRRMTGTVYKLLPQITGGRPECNPHMSKLFYMILLSKHLANVCIHSGISTATKGNPPGSDVQDKQDYQNADLEVY